MLRLLFGVFTALFCFSAFAVRTSSDSKPPDCSREDIVRAAAESVEAHKGGRLYGVDIWTDDTRLKGKEGYLACAKVVSAILRKAGCDCVREKQAVEDVYDDLTRANVWDEGGGLLDAAVEPGDILIWNTWGAVNLGNRMIGNENRYAPVGVRYEGRGPVAYRHIGVAISTSQVVDNSPAIGPELKYINGYNKLQYGAPVILRMRGQNGCRGTWVDRSKSKPPKAKTGRG